MLFARLKKLAKQLPFAFTQNQRYDLLTRRIIKQACTPHSCCVDAGAHVGGVLDLFLRAAPEGFHHAFEPVPELYQFLQHRYGGKRNCRIYPLALSDKNGTSQFNHVVSNPAYSGLKKRRYDRRGEKDTVIEVETARLDDVIGMARAVRVIKIDVEGGEMDVLRGATRILNAFHPLVIFEFGIGGSDMYGTTPDMLFSFFEQYDYAISLMDDYLGSKPALTRNALNDQFYGKKNYYFVAHQRT